MRRLLIRTLAKLAARVVARYSPGVVGVTGSVGKTTTAHAALAVLRAGGLRAGGAHGNYNNELGLPLTVLGANAPGQSPVAWIGVFLRALRLLAQKDPEYPTHLVLEYGADHPGDIVALLRIAVPQVAVLTAVTPAHLEYFGTVEAVAAEKGMLIQALPGNGVALLNADDPIAMAQRVRTRARVVTYGIAEGSDVRCLGAHLALTGTHEPQGVRWNLTYGSDAGEVQSLGTIGRSTVRAALAGAAVGFAFGIPFRTVLEAVQEFHPPAGRMRLLPGRGGAVLVDDSYNSSPEAVKEALDALAELRMATPVRRRSTVVLGTMAELGAQSEALHRQVGEKVAAINPERLMTVGTQAQFIAEGARAAGFPDARIRQFPSAEEAANALAPDTHGGDIVLIKGSQSARLERITGALLADPADASRLLVRQSAAWRNQR